MCRRVTCSMCGKPTFSGCGMHVEQVLAEVPADDRCQCKETHSAAPQQRHAQGLWKRLFG
jgi:hypothetical protein